MTPDFSLIETLRFEPATGLVRLKLHAQRLKNSAKVLGFAAADAALSALHEATADATAPLRMRLELFADGRREITSAPYTALAENTV